MPKTAKPLTAVEVRRIVTPGFHPVGGVPGLLLQVAKGGSRSWVLRASIAGRRRDMGLGGFPEVGLAAAREKARGLREVIRAGRDPIAERQAARAAVEASRQKRLLFSDACDKYLKAKTVEFRNAKHAAQWSATLHHYALPVLGNLPVDQIELAHVVKILEPIWRSKTETATRLRGRIEAVLAWSTVSGFRSGPNPAAWRGNLEAVLPKPGKLKTVVHHRALPIDEAPAFMLALRAREGIAARALEFAVLTAARSGEVRGAAWSEIDLDAGTWTVPASRMKAGEEHVVPLSDAAIALIESLPRPDNAGVVFVAPRGGQLTDMSLSAVTRRMGIDATPHGFRSTFRDWCSERTSFAHEVVEKSLAHKIANPVERAYRRGSLLVKRRKLMQAWSHFLAKPLAETTVATLNRAAGSARS